METKICTKCGNEWPITDFFRQRTRGPTKRKSYCKHCAKLEQREWRKKNPDWEKRRYAKEVLATRERHLIRKYGVNLARYDAMFAAQDGRCKVCKHKKDKVLDVDHCHTTGVVRGLLCGNCNRMIGYANDDPTVLREAAAYLEETR